MRGDGKRWIGSAAMLALAIGCSYLCPPVALLLALTMPLTVCPMLADQRAVCALLLPFAPCVGFLVSGDRAGLVPAANGPAGAARGMGAPQA